MRILYLRQSRDTVNNVYVKGLEENEVEVLNLYFKPRIFSDLVKLIKTYRKERNNIDMIMVGFSSPQLAIIARLISTKKIIYNATVSVYDRLINSRELAQQFSIKALYYIILDFLASHFSNLTMVESNSQGEFFKNKLILPARKIYRAWIGVDEDRFIYDPSVPKADRFTVLFRGMFLPESGVEYAIKAAKILEKDGVQFVIIGGGARTPEILDLIEELKPSNLKLINDFLPQDDLNKLILSSHLILGQLSDHVRLNKTIPYKAYESLAMKRPYLTASNRGILELLTPNKTCFVCNPADAKSLAEKILWLKKNPQELERIAQNGYNFYKSELKSGILAKNLLNKISQLN